MALKINCGVASSINDLQQILTLQSQNLPTNISDQEAKKEGFVTLRHDLDLLAKMNTPYPHVVAKNGEEVVGYALVMLKSFSQELPILVPMFEQLEKIAYGDKKLREQRYFVMGQVCIKKGYRGQGILASMYRELQERMKADFDYMVTEIAIRNQRSISAHAKLGFEEIHAFRSDEGVKWSIVLLDLQA